MISEEKLAALRKAREPKQKKVYKGIAKVSAKRAAKIEEEKELRNSGDDLLEKWFSNRRKEMTGKCLFCGGKTEKDNFETFKRSIAHLLPKRDNMFPSVKYNKDNWLELCFYGNSCHTNFDNGIISWELLKDSKEWEIIVRKFKILEPMLTEEEKSRKLYSHLVKLVYGN